jgi:hypothetical protein
LLGRRIAQRVSVGLLVAAALSLVLAIGFSLNAIASIGSAVALLIFGMCTVAHFRVRSETGARLSLLILAVTTAGIALAAFLLDLIINDPASVAAMLVIVLLAVILDLAWKRARAQRAHVSGPAPTVAPAAVEDRQRSLPPRAGWARAHRNLIDWFAAPPRIHPGRLGPGRRRDLGLRACRPTTDRRGPGRRAPRR